MKKVLLFIAFVTSLSSFADGLSVLNFKLLESDLTANTRGTERRDKNGDKAALIKIVCPEKDFTFEGGNFGIVGTEQQYNEIWLYVPPKSNKLTIKHPLYGVLRDFYYPVDIQGGRTYEMILDPGTGRYTTIVTEMARSLVYADGENLGRSPIYYKYLTYGHHEITASNDRFEGTVTVDIKPSDDKFIKVINIEMHNISNLFGDVQVTTTGEIADIYFEGTRVGSNLWSTQLREGEYTIELRSPAGEYEPLKRRINVERQRQNNFTITVLGPSFKEYAKKQVTSFLSEWQKKKEFETTQQWKNRVNEDTRNNKIKEQMDIAKRYYIQRYSRPYNPTLGTYDADYNVFPVTADEKTLYVQVPLNEAQQFKEKWHQVKINPEYDIIDGYVGVASCTFTLKNKTYGLMQQTNRDNSEDLALDLPPVDFDDMLGSPNSSKDAKSESIDRSMDMNIPETGANNANTFAVIIGNEKYTQVSQVPFANNDAQIFAEYCMKTLGMPAKNVKVYKNATFGAMIGAISDIQKIAKAYKGDINVIFYYAGHGIPNEATGDAYLLPIDADGIHTEVCYPLNRLYKELGELNAKSVTAFMDACFSGSQRGNGMIVAARGVAIKAKNERPMGKTVVFTAATDKQTAFPFKEKQHGMFTYYLLKKIRESKGNCTLGELGAYVCDEVAKQAIVTNGKEQTPVVLTSMGITDDWKNMKLK